MPAWQAELGDVDLAALRMGSSLEGLLEVPLASWPVLGLGLLLLTERLATMPVRIARKRRQELPKSVLPDRQTTLVVEGRADVLVELLREEGPVRPMSALDDVALLDPENPEDELEPALVPGSS